MSASRRGFLQSLFGLGVASALPKSAEARPVVAYEGSTWERTRSALTEDDVKQLLDMPDLDRVSCAQTNVPMYSGSGIVMYSNTSILECRTCLLTGYCRIHSFPGNK